MNPITNIWYIEQINFDKEKDKQSSLAVHKKKAS